MEDLASFFRDWVFSPFCELAPIMPWRWEDQDDGGHPPRELGSQDAEERVLAAGYWKENAEATDFLHIFTSWGRHVTKAAEQNRPALSFTLNHDLLCGGEGVDLDLREPEPPGPDTLTDQAIGAWWVEMGEKSGVPHTLKAYRDAYKEQLAKRKAGPILPVSDCGTLVEEPSGELRWVPAGNDRRMVPAEGKSPAFELPDPELPVPPLTPVQRFWSFVSRIGSGLGR